MLKGLKVFLKRYPVIISIHRAMIRFALDLVDIYDLYFPAWRRRKIATPYGFILHIGRSAAHRPMQRGTFEADEIALIQSCMIQTDVFVDVGANIGLYTCLAAMAGKQIIAVEPQLRNLNILYANLIENGYMKAEVYPVALSDQPGLAEIYGVSGTGASLISGWCKQSKRFHSTVPLTTLDILLSDRLTDQRLLIKVDVEGAEFGVLQGAQRTLVRSPRPIWMIEITLNGYFPGLNPNFASIFEMFWQHGYEVHTADIRRQPVRPADVERWVKAGKCDSSNINYIFTPTESSV